MQLVTWNTQWCCGLDGVVSPQRIVDRTLGLILRGGLGNQQVDLIAEHEPDPPICGAER